MSDNINYGNLMHDAMRGLIQRVLTQVAKDGLPGEHHFFISFETGHADVELADWLSDRFPDDMTIVMQHWFDDLDVGDQGFGITLNFGDQPEHMYVPYDAIRTFVDPSVEFGLKFESQDSDDKDVTTPHPIEVMGKPQKLSKSKAKPKGKDKAKPESKDAPEDKPAKKDADVVSLDAFRK